jgi:hypothetical protein
MGSLFLDQNSGFNPNCTMREFTLIALICPNVRGLETSPAGLAKFGRLKTLKISQRKHCRLSP